MGNSFPEAQAIRRTAWVYVKIKYGGLNGNVQIHQRRLETTQSEHAGVMAGKTYPMAKRANHPKD